MPRADRRNVILLALCQALYLSAAGVGLTLTGIVGYSLATDKAWATLPFALITVATAACTVPLSFFMGRFGRRAGFMLGSTSGALGGLVAASAIVEQSFGLFCLGTACLGVAQASAQYYRFAAADAAEPAFKSRAVSYVLAGGVVAAVAGPALGAWAKDLLAPITFAGSYLAVTALFLVAVGVLGLLRIPEAPAAARGEGRSLIEIARQPAFVAALINGVVAYGVMMFVMTATPLAAVACNHSVADTASVIQWHLVGMFAPAFFTGHLIARFGITLVMLAGAAMFLLGAGAALSGISLAHFWLALALNGAAWNFMYVGATTLLTRAYRPEERAKTQAASEFVTFGVVALGSLAAGGVFAGFGWATVNLVIVPLLLAAAVATMWYALRERAGRVSSEVA